MYIWGNWYLASSVLFYKAVSHRHHTDDNGSFTEVLSYRTRGNSRNRDSKTIETFIS